MKVPFFIKLGLILIVILDILYLSILSFGKYLDIKSILNTGKQIQELSLIRSDFDEKLMSIRHSLENEYITEQELLHYSKNLEWHLGEFIPDKICYHNSFNSQFDSSLNWEQQIEYDKTCVGNNINADEIRGSLYKYFERIENERLQLENKGKDYLSDSLNDDRLSQIGAQIKLIITGPLTPYRVIMLNILFIFLSILVFGITSLKKINLGEKEIIREMIHSRKYKFALFLAFLVIFLFLGKYLYNISQGRICPDQKIIAPYMPRISQEIAIPKKKDGYIVINGERKNIENYDIFWIIENCRNPDYSSGY